LKTNFGNLNRENRKWKENIGSEMKIRRDRNDLLVKPLAVLVRATKRDLLSALGN